jgi:isoprenylcysteine carboxyl methyltransferase (ICMT) family protein YpbQ
LAAVEVYRHGAQALRWPLLQRAGSLLLSNAVPAVFFGFFCGVKALFVVRALNHLGSVTASHQVWYPVIKLGDQVLGLLYFGLIAFLCVTRLPRRGGRRGVGTVAASLFAAFAIMLIGVLPDRRSRPEMEVLGDILLGLGMAYSMWALVYLRRSFSILPEARRLVTRGPYGLSRHPLYLGESVAALGLLITSAGPTAVALALAALGVQLLRMSWEESVLTREFPEYGAYACRVPRYLPFLA